jgi:hypothetical protein
MANSTIRLNVSPTYTTVVQNSHNFVTGSIICSSGSANIYVAAKADTLAGAETVGYVTQVVDANTFNYISSGMVTTGVPVATAGSILFLSPTVAGALTATEPTTAGQISKPLLTIIESGTKAIFNNMRGVVVSAGTATYLQTVWVPAEAMSILPSSGSAATTVQLDTGSYNMPVIASLDFDPLLAEYAQFTLGMPKSWNEGTVNSQFCWTHVSASGPYDVIWGIKGLAISGTETISASYGTAVVVTGSGGIGNNLYTSALSPNITIGGSPVENDLVYFQVYRDATAAADSLGVDAKLIGTKIFMTVNSLTDL